MKAKNSGPAVAAVVSGSTAILLITVLFILAEANEPVHDVLDFIPAMGPLSGKIILSYSSGLAMFLALRQLLKKKNPGLWRWALVSLLILALATAFSYMPLIEAII